MKNIFNVIKNKFSLMIALCFLVGSALAQDASSLNVGDIAPSLVLNSNNNSIQSFSFPYQNRITLLFFWSSSVAKSKENIYKYKRIYTKYADVGYKTAEGFDMISVAMQSDKNAWMRDLEKYNLAEINNCISLRGYSDMFIKNYKISSTPSSFLIDETGKIVAVNPSIKTIIEYLDSKRNVELNTDVQTKISGKIMFGNKTLQALSGEMLYFIKGQDTLKSMVIGEKGDFFIDNLNTQENLKVLIKSTNKIQDDQTIYITSENGEIVSDFFITDSGFENTILDAEMAYLKSSSDNQSSVISDKSLKDLYTNEQIFLSKETVLSADAKNKLSKIVIKLKENPKTKLEIISHTNAIGDAKNNLTLTVKQSNAVVNFLISKEIDKSRLKPIGKGELEILNKCKDGVKCSDSEQKENCRTEFKFFPL